MLLVLAMIISCLKKATRGFGRYSSSLVFRGGEPYCLLPHAYTDSGMGWFPTTHHLSISVAPRSIV